MNRPNILPTTLGPSLEIDGVNLHDLGVLLHTITPRGMPPITPNRQQTARHGAVIGDEYYTPSPLNISGQMVADSHPELIANQRFLTSLLSRRQPFRLIDHLTPALYRACIYDGQCAFGDASPRRSGTACSLSFSVLVNPPWLQATSLSHDTIPTNPGTAIIHNDGNVPAGQLLTFQPNAETSIIYVRETLRFIPNSALAAEVAISPDYTVSPHVVSAGLSSTLIAPSDDSRRTDTAPHRQRQARFPAPPLGFPIHPELAIHMVIAPRQATSDLSSFSSRGVFEVMRHCANDPAAHSTCLCPKIPRQGEASGQSRTVTARI